MNNEERLQRIAEIIESVDNRCMAADGSVTATLEEMTQAEMSEIYKLASEQVVQGDVDSEPCEHCNQYVGHCPACLHKTKGGLKMETPEQNNAYHPLIEGYGLVLIRRKIMDEIIRVSEDVFESYNKLLTKKNKAMDINIIENEVSKLRKENGLCIKLEEIPRFDASAKSYQAVANVWHPKKPEEYVTDIGVVEVITPENISSHSYAMKWAVTQAKRRALFNYLGLEYDYDKAPNIDWQAYPVNSIITLLKEDEGWKILAEHTC